MQPSEMPEQDENLQNLSSEQEANFLQSGEAAAELLQSPIYNQAYQMCMNEIFMEWMNSEPHEKNLREGLYFQRLGMATQAEKFSAAVRAAQQVLRQQQEKHDPQVQEQERLDEQGFGIQY